MAEATDLYCIVLCFLSKFWLHGHTPFVKSPRLVNLGIPKVSSSFSPKSKRSICEGSESLGSPYIPLFIFLYSMLFCPQLGVI